MPDAPASASWSRPITRRSATTTTAPDARHASPIDYAVQPIADGTARAVQSAQRYAGRDPFLVLNSDNLYPAPVLRALVELDGPGLPAYAADSLVRDSGFPRDRVTGFAAIEVDDRGHLTRIVEKPGRDYYDAHGIARADQHERVAIRRAHLRCVPRCAAVGARRIRAAGSGRPRRSSRGVVFRTFRASGAVLDLSRRSRRGRSSTRGSPAWSRAHELDRRRTSNRSA